MVGTPPDIDSGIGLVSRVLKLAKRPCLFASLILTAVVWLIYSVQWPDHPLEFSLTSTIFFLAAMICYLTRYVVRKALSWLKKTDSAPNN